MRRVLRRTSSRDFGEKDAQHNQLVGCEVSRADFEIAAEVVNENILNLAGVPVTQS